MSTVIVKEKTTVSSEISAARRLTRSPAFAARRKRKPRANALTNNSERIYETTS